MTGITLADVAKRAGVSTATVSMVLCNKGRISQSTRERVLKALDESGYVYNQTAANLRNRSSNQVGLLLHDITNPFYSEMTAGLSHEMERHELMLFLANSEESAERQQKFVDSLMRNNVGGMVLCAARETPQAFFEGLKRRNIPAIMVVRPLNDPDFDFVGTDNFLGTQMATEHLLRMGHRHIAFIGGSQNSGSRAQYRGLYQQAAGVRRDAESCLDQNLSRQPKRRRARGRGVTSRASTHQCGDLLSGCCGAGGDAKLTQDGP